MCARLGSIFRSEAPKGLGLAVFLQMSIAWTWFLVAGISPGEEAHERGLFDTSRVHRVELTIPNMDWDVLRYQRREFVDSMVQPNAKPFDYFKATLKIDELEVPDVAIRKKGFLGSQDDDFPSLRIKINEYVDQSPWGPIKRLALNNNKQDISLLSQYMTYGLFNQAGIAAPRVAFATVFVNGKHLGVYSMVESVDKPFLKTHFGDSSGDLLEGTIADFSTKSIPRMEWKSGRSAEQASWRVNRLAELLESESIEIEQVGALVDLDSFLTYWTVESAIAFWDGYNSNQNNYFVFDDPKVNKLKFIPWGADAAWVGMGGPFAGFAANPPNSIYATSLLPHRLFQHSDIQTRYRDRMRRLMEQHWNEAELVAKLDEASLLITEHQHVRQRGSASAQKAMKRFIQSRKKKIIQELDEWPVKIPEKARRPMYTSVVGETSGEFQCFWQREPKDRNAVGKLLLNLDGNAIELSDVKVVSKRFSMGLFGMGAAAAQMPPIVEMKGRSSNNEYTLTLSFDNRSFKSSGGKKIDIRGSLNQSNAAGAFSGFGFGGMKFVQGTCTLTSAGTQIGAEVRGDFSMEVLQVRGGFFEQTR